jgi:hypothetical protein
MASRQKASPTASRPETKGRVAHHAKPLRLRGARPNGAQEQRYVMIEQAAYFRAARRGFEPGHELDDWLAAEAEIENLVGASGRSASRAAQGQE